MRIAIDISPLTSEHRVRGTGYYTKHLTTALQKYFPNNTYYLFSKGESVPEDTQIIHYPYFEPFFWTLPIQKKYPSIITVHDLIPLVYPQYFPSGVKGYIKWQIQKNLLKKMNAILTDSEASKKDIHTFTQVPLEHVHVVYLAAAEIFLAKKMTSRERLTIRNKFNLPDKFVLYVGDVTGNKNLPNLLRAIDKTTTQLVMVGKAIADGAYDKKNLWNADRNEIRRLSENNNQIHRLGFVSDEDLVSLYNMATVFVLPSFSEGFGLPVLEAMQSGCPVITTKGGSLPEIAQDAAYYVEFNANSIAQGIQAVFDDKNLQEELTVKGLQQASKFTWQKTAAESIKIYERSI